MSGKSIQLKSLPSSASPARLARAATLAGLLALGLAGCATTQSPDVISDPHEARNRAVHRFNLGLDRAVLRPVARGADRTLPDPLVEGISNFADNLELPGRVVNNVLQLRFGRAIENTLRFAINTTVGIGGLFDPATGARVYGKPTDFGETLHVWGVGEGNYVELPFLGPSTERDALGQVVDIALDPLALVWPDQGEATLLAKIAGKIADRARYSETVDSILYDSADSYAQARLLYLQNRRFELGQALSEDSYEDPYAE
jgi:phospholipid-binding lipoprotein MlaA